MSSLAGITIAVTKSRKAVESAFREILEAGAEVVCIPSITTVPIINNQPFLEALKEIGKFDFLIFTSAAAAGFFAKAVKENGPAIDYTTLKVACVGLKTSDACKENGIPVDIIPHSFSAAGLSEELIRRGIEGRRILIPSSSIAREELQIKLKDRGAEVHSIPVYETKLPDSEEIKTIREIFTNKKIDIIAFTSPSNFSNFLVIFNVTKPAEFLSSYTIGAIGHTTRNAIAGAQIKVDIVPEEATLEGLARAVINFYKK